MPGLPSETKGPLTFTELLSTIDLVVGEVVCARFDTQQQIEPVSQTVFQASGILRPLELSFAPSYAVGELFILVLDESDFVAADIYTFDGNSFYEIGMQFSKARVIIGSPEHMGADYEGF